MPSIYLDEFERSASEKSRDEGRLADQANRLVTQNEQLLSQITNMPEAAGVPQAPSTLAVLDQRTGTQFVSSLKGLMARVDEFGVDELDPNERLFLKRTILEIFKAPRKLGDGNSHAILSDRIHPSQNIYGVTERLGGAFVEAAGRAAVRIDVNPGTTNSDVRIGPVTPKADELERDVRALAESVGEAVDKYYEHGLHRKATAAPAMAPGGIG